MGSRWGQYKHWIAVSIPILMLAVYMVFLPNEESVSALSRGWLLVLYGVWPILSIAHQSWGRSWPVATMSVRDCTGGVRSL